MRAVEHEQVADAELVLSPGVQGALGERVSAAKGGLLALSVGVGFGVLSTLMEKEVSKVVGPKGGHDLTALRFVRARLVARSRWAGGVSLSRGARVPSVDESTSSLRGTRTLPIATRSLGWCSSRCSPA